MPEKAHLLTACLCILLGQPLGAATLKLSGLPLDKKEELVAQLSPRLDFIKSRPPSPWRADDAAFFLRRLLIRQGHADADVKWELPGGNVILLKANAGQRYRYGEIRAANASPVNRQLLRSYFLQPLVETETVKEENAPYIAEYNQPGVANVNNWLKSRGYWRSSVRIARLQTDNSGKRVHVLLDIRPGPLHKVAGPTFSGVTPQERTYFLEQAKPYLGKAADTGALAALRNTVEGYYKKHGYEFSSIRVAPHHSGGFTRLHFTIRRGRVFEVDDVLVLGNGKTKSRRIRRYFDALRNRHYDRAMANAALGKLLATGAFTRATLRTVPHANGTLDLAVDVEEAKARSLRSYAGVGSYEGFILGTSYTDLNFRGRLLRLNLRGEYSSRGFLGEAGVTEPHFAGEAIELNFRAYLLRRTYEGYDKQEAGLEAALLWSPARHLSSRLYFGISRVSASTTSLTPMELGPKDYIHMRAGFQQTLDLRDSAILPTRGFYGSALFEYGTVAGDASNGYARGQIDLSYRIPVHGKHTLMARLSTGAIEPDDSRDLPIDLRLFSGGSDSVRSFDSRELGPRSLSNDPLGGQAFWHASLQYTHVVSEPVSAVVFLDAGQVHRDFSDFGFSDPSYAAGIGVRIELPIGPVRLEYGHNLNRRKGEPAGTLHFAIGTSF